MLPTDLNIGETRVWRLDSGPNLQPCLRVTFMADHRGFQDDFLLGMASNTQQSIYSVSESSVDLK